MNGHQYIYLRVLYIRKLIIHVYSLFMYTRLPAVCRHLYITLYKYYNNIITIWCILSRISIAASDYTHTRARSLSHMFTRLPNNIPEFRTAVHFHYNNNMYNIVITYFIIICFTCFDHRIQKINIYTIFYFTEKKK